MEEKELLREKFEAELKEMKAKIDFLEAKAAQAKAETKIEYQKQLEDLRRKRDDLGNRLNDLKQAGGDAWKDIRDGLESAAGDLKSALDRAMDKFR